MTNRNPNTNIRYGVIACASLDDDVVEELMYGAQARNLSEEAAAEEAHKQARDRADEVEDLAAQMLHERDPLMPVLQFAELLVAEVEAAYESLGHADREDFIDNQLAHQSDYVVEEPTIEGTVDDVKYEISWLGGAPLLWVLEGPEGVANKLCSPCVPNAADLDGGFVLGDEMLAEQDYSHHFGCYCVPRDWLRKDL
jgi:hypothetical protein